MKGASLFKKLGEATPEATPGGATVSETSASAEPAVNPPPPSKPSGGLFGAKPKIGAEIGKNAAAAAPATEPTPQKAEALPETKPAMEPAAVQSVPETPPPAKPKRGRPAKAPEAAAEAAESPQLMVLVDCLPQAGLGEGKPLVKVAAPAMLAAAAAFGKANWRLIEYTSAGSLAEYFDRQIAAEPLTGVVLVDSDSAEGKALLPVLEAVATVVIRGC